MTFSIYTDAAWHIQRGAAFAFVIIRPNGKIVRYSQRINVLCANPTEAELMAIGHAVNFIAKRYPLTASDIILAYSDCKPAIDYLSRKYAKNQRLVAICDIIHSMSPAIIQPQRISDTNEYVYWCHKQARYNTKQ